MRAIVVERFGGPEVLELREVPSPVAGPGQLLVAIGAAGVNYRDIYEREGAEGHTPPFVSGIEGAGTVQAVGDGVEGFAPGDRVGWVSAQGSYAEQVAFDAARAVPLPPGVPADLAAAALLQGITAQYLATDAYAVKPGDNVLIHAAAGGVGLLLTQVAKLRGGRVIATTSGEDKARLAREAGADEVIGYDDFATRVRELTGGAGVAAVYDGIGATTFEASLSALRRRGTMVLFGAASGPAPLLDPRRLVAGGSLYLTRPTIRDYTATREELLARAGEVLGWVASGALRVRIGGRYPLAEAARAQRDLASRATTGKLILLPG